MGTIDACYMAGNGQGELKLGIQSFFFGLYTSYKTHGISLCGWYPTRGTIQSLQIHTSISISATFSTICVFIAGCMK